VQRVEGAFTLGRSTDFRAVRLTHFEEITFLFGEFLDLTALSLECSIGVDCYPRLGVIIREELGDSIREVLGVNIRGGKSGDRSGSVTTISLTRGENIRFLGDEILICSTLNTFNSGTLYFLSFMMLLKVVETYSCMKRGEI